MKFGNILEIFQCGTKHVFVYILPSILLPNRNKSSVKAKLNYLLNEWMNERKSITGGNDNYIKAFFGGLPLPGRSGIVTRPRPTDPNGSSHSGSRPIFPPGSVPKVPSGACGPRAPSHPRGRALGLLGRMEDTVAKSLRRPQACPRASHPFRPWEWSTHHPVTVPPVPLLPAEHGLRGAGSRGAALTWQSLFVLVTWGFRQFGVKRHRWNLR